MNELTSVQDKREAKAEAESQAEVDRFMFRHGLVPFSTKTDAAPAPEPTHEATANEPHKPTPPTTEHKEKPVMSKEFIDTCGNFINLDAATKYPARPPEIENTETPKPSILLRTRLGAFFLLTKGEDGQAAYRPLNDMEVESFARANAYDVDTVMSVEATEELREISMRTGEL